MRFADAVVMVWYPQLLTLESAQLPQRLQAACDGRRAARLAARAADACSSPTRAASAWSAAACSSPTRRTRCTTRSPAARMQYLVDVLGQHDGASFLLERREA